MGELINLISLISSISLWNLSPRYGGAPIQSFTRSSERSGN